MDSPVLILMEYSSVVHCTERICRNALAYCCIASIQCFWSYEDIKIQAEVLVMVLQIN